MRLRVLPPQPIFSADPNYPTIWGLRKKSFSKGRSQESGNGIDNEQFPSTLPTLSIAGFDIT
ncbi:MAG: hypothetical protein F6K17_01685 [Okeania sp. SIO3C4]|nr:hypothetical protein [Okeania sp. SIO3C4]